MADRSGYETATDVSLIDETTGSRLSVDGGKAALTAPRAEVQDGFSPDPYFQPSPASADGSARLNTISAGSLAVRGQALTDEGGYRDDFGADVIQTSTGTAVFTNGSDVVTGTGFLTEGLSRDWHISAAGRASTELLKVFRVDSDTKLYLEAPYAGASAVSATYTKAKWIVTIVGTASQSVASSIVSLVSGTTAGNYIGLTREADYEPLSAFFYASLTVRSVNQLAYFGLAESQPTCPSAYVQFTGTDNTVATFQTASSTSVSDVETTTFKIPLGKTSADMLRYRVEVRPGACILFVEETQVARHTKHIPGQYDTLLTSMGIANTGAATSTTLAVDVVSVTNFNVIDTQALPPDYFISDSAVLTAAGQYLAHDTRAYPSHSIVVTGTWTGSVVAESSSDGGQTWISNSVFIPSQGAAGAGIPIVLTSITANGTYRLGVAGSTTSVRARLATLSTGGPVNVVLTSSLAPNMFGFSNSAIIQNVVQSPLNGTVATVASPVGTAQNNNLAPGTTWAGTAESTLGAGFIQFMFACDGSSDVYVDQSIDGTNWDHTDHFFFSAGSSDGKSIICLGGYYRMRVINRGAVNTTYIRLGTYLCPVSQESEVLAGASQHAAFYPSPLDYPTSDKGVIAVDAWGSLMTRGPVFTDEGGFNDRFPGSSLQSNLTGTGTLVTGLDRLAGVGTLFGTELPFYSYVRISTDTDANLTQVSLTDSDTASELIKVYPGTGGTGTIVKSNWFQGVSGTGAAITVGSSICNLVSGTANAGTAFIYRGSDSPTLMLQIRASVSQRIANQTTLLGFQNHETSPTYQANFKFTGTTNTIVTCQCIDSTGEVMTSDVTLPAGVTTAVTNLYEIWLEPDRVSFYCNGAQLVVHRDVNPPSYELQGIYCGISNQAVVTTTTVALKSVSLLNVDRFDANVRQADPSKLNMTPYLVTRTSLPVASGSSVPVSAMGDKFGRQVVQLGSIRELRGIANITLTSTTGETTLIAAGGTGVYNDLLMLVVSNTSNNTNTLIDFRSATGGAIIFTLQSPGNSTTGFSIPGTSIPQAATNTVWTAQCGTSTNSIRIFAVYEKNQ